MSNKILVIILVLLVLVISGTGYYAFNLNQQVNNLETRLVDFERSQQAGLAMVTGELGSLRAETSTGLTSLQEDVKGTKSDVSTLTDNLAAAREGIEGEISQVTTSVKNLDSRVATTEQNLTGIAGSNIDTASLYRKASQATVRISAGQSVLGSGFILDKEGHVVTAEHVIAGRSPIYVTLYDGRVFQAGITGVSEASDVAVLKIPALDVEIPALADSSRVNIGDPVAAIGAPLGLKDSLSSGIISQVNRAEEIPYDNGTRFISNLFQFDAPINFGNSGCPLFSKNGEVIGLVIARVEPGEGDGIDWAVASNKVKRVAIKLIASGVFDYPWVGTNIADLTPQTVQEMGLADANGSLVMSVTAGSPADNAGMRVRDVIIAMDGRQIKDTSEMTSYLGEFKSPGDVMALEVIRNGTRVTLTLTVGKRP